MGLISPGGQNLLDFLELRQVLSTYDGSSGTSSGVLRKGQSPCEFLGGLSGFVSRRCRGLRPCVESGPEPEDSSPVPTWILGHFWSLPRGVSPRLECGHAFALSLERRQHCHTVCRVEQRIYVFPSSLSHEVFPRGFPTGLSHVPPWWESILSLKVEAVQQSLVSILRPLSRL